MDYSFKILVFSSICLLITNHYINPRIVKGAQQSCAKKSEPETITNAIRTGPNPVPQIVKCSNPRCAGQCKICNPERLKPENSIVGSSPRPNLKPQPASSWVQKYKEEEQRLAREDRLIHQPELVNKKKSFDEFKPVVLSDSVNTDITNYFGVVEPAAIDADSDRRESPKSVRIRPSSQDDRQKLRYDSELMFNRDKSSFSKVPIIGKDAYAVKQRIVSVADIRNRLYAHSFIDRIYGNEDHPQPTLQCKRCSLETTADGNAVTLHCFGCVDISKDNLDENDDDDLSNTDSDNEIVKVNRDF